MPACSLSLLKRHLPLTASTNPVGANDTDMQCRFVRGLYVYLGNALLYEHCKQIWYITLLPDEVASSGDLMWKMTCIEVGKHARAAESMSFRLVIE